MNTNIRILILLALSVISISMFIYNQMLKNSVSEQFVLYEKTANEIAIIKKLKTYYGDKKSNKRKIYNIIGKYKEKIVTKKEDKSSLEFTISKLNEKELSGLNKTILNSGVKILKLKIKKLNRNSGELYCKVVF